MQCAKCHTPLISTARFCNICGTPVSTPTAFSNTPSAPQAHRPRRRRWNGCLISSVITLLGLLLLLSGAWLFVIRPYLHSLVQNQMDQVLSLVVDQVNPTLGLLIPVGTTIPVNETALNSVLSLSNASPYLIQDARVSITPNGVRTDFQVRLFSFSFPCSISGIPQVVNGQLIMNNVTVNGILAFFMSSSEMQAEINKYLVLTQNRLHRSITTVTLQNHQINLTFN